MKTFLRPDCTVKAGLIDAQGNWIASPAVSSSDHLLQGTSITSENGFLLFWKGEAQYRSGQKPAALRTYADALAKIEGVTNNNVTRRGFAGSYLRFGELLSETDRLDEAVSAVTTGLRLNPQNIEGQILLGHLLEQGSQHTRAIAYYQSHLNSACLSLNALCSE